MAVTKVFQMLEDLVVAVVAEIIQSVAMELRVKAIMVVMQRQVRVQAAIVAAAVAGLGLLAATLRVMRVDTVAMGCTATSQER
jgi:hypothetical protein